MDHWQRLFTYVTGSIVIGLLLIILTNSYLHYVNEQGSTGYIALFAFGFVYLNLGYGVNRRFIMKSPSRTTVSYVMSFLMVVPTLLWIFTKDEGLGESILVFTLTIMFAVFLGTFFGIKGGLSKREAYLRQMEQEVEPDLPDDLKRPHDDLNQN